MTFQFDIKVEISPSLYRKQDELNLKGIRVLLFYLPQLTAQAFGHSRKVAYGLLWQCPSRAKALQSFRESWHAPSQKNYCLYW